MEQKLLPIQLPIQTEIITTKVNKPTLEERLKRGDFVVDYFDIYILTSIERQHGMKIKHFIDKFQHSAQILLEPQLPIVGFEKCIPTINLYVRCDDEKLSEKSMKILSALYNEVLAKGIKIKLFALNGNKDKFAIAVNNMINKYQIEQTRKEFLKQSMQLNK